MKWFDDMMGITSLNNEILDLRAQCSNQWQLKNDALGQLNMLKKDYQKISDQFNAATASLSACTTLTQGDKETIKQLWDSIDALTAKLQISADATLYKKPTPALLQETPAKQVMLGQFVVWTAQGRHLFDYPDHPSIFMPCPIFESVLTLAGCNRKRDDLTPVQISKAIANVFQTSEVYLDDQTQWGIADNWTPAVLVRLLGGDDCESEATAILSAIFYYQLKFGAFKEHTCALGLGHLNWNGNSYGHGFVLLLHDTSTDLKDSYIIEATDQWASLPMPISEQKLVYDADWGIIGFVREDYPDGTYIISPGARWWGSVAEKKTGTLGKIKELIFGAPADEEKKQALKEFAKERQKKEG